MFSVERSNPTTEISVYLILLIGHNRAASENKKYAGTQLSKTVRENEKKKTKDTRDINTNEALSGKHAAYAEATINTSTRLKIKRARSTHGS